MFKFRQQGNLIDLIGDGLNFKNLSFSVKTEDNKNYKFAVDKVEDNLIHGANEAAEMTVKLCEVKGVLALTVEGALIRDRSKGLFFDNAKSNLDAYEAFSLTFSEIEGLKSYTVATLGTFWTEPDVVGGNDIKKVPAKTQAIVYEGKDNFGALFAPCDKRYKSVFVGKEEGLSVTLQSHKRGMMDFSSTLLFLAVGNDPYTLPEKIAEQGLKFLGKKAAPAKDKRYPEMFEYLGWCSWDAFPLCVTHEGILEKAEEFKSKNIPVRWGIIDDMWSTLDGENSVSLMHDRKLFDFKADPKQFPKGLKSAISEVKEKYGLKIGIWHPLTGYWYGFDPKGATAKEFSKYLTQTEDGRLVVKPTAEDMFGYHNAMYSYLKDAGVDFVKVDNQSSIEWFYRNMGTVGEVADAVHTGIEGAVGLNFDGTVINCMGCASENIWNRPNSLINRCSNDFLPEDRNWFIKHIMQCTYNCYFYSGFFLGDFDMFWTDDGQAVKNCLLRAMSGGPVYVSDKVGRSVAERLLPLVLADGKILRCNNSAVPTYDCLTVDPRTSKKAYKVWNCTDNGFVMAAFNLDDEEKPVQGSLSPAKLPNAKSDKYLAYDFFSGEAEILKTNENIEFSLNNYDDFKFYNFIPVEDGFAPIGLTDKYITSASFNKFGKNKYTVLNGGIFAFYSEKTPKAVLVDGEKVSPIEKKGYYTVDLGEIKVSHILEFEF